MTNRGPDGRFVPGKTGNPTGRPRSDAWQNTITGVGTSRYDKRLQSTFISDRVSYPQAVQLMKGDDIASKAVRKVVNDALRPGVDLKVSPDISDPKGVQEMVETRWDDLAVADHVKTVGEYERSFGGGAIMIGVQDGQEDLRKPLDLSRVRGLDYLTVYEPREIIPSYYYGNPVSKQFRRPSMYQVSPILSGISDDMHVGAFEVHETRIIPFGGVRVNSDSTHNGWGESVLTSLWRVLRDFNSSWDAVGTITQDYAQSVLKIKDLWKMFADNDMESFKSRMEAIELSRSVCRMTIVDSEEDFERKTVNLGGLPQLLDRIESRMAGAANYPVTVLFGRSPAGMNATGEHDMENYRDTLGDYAARRVLPTFRRVAEILMASEGIFPKSWKVECRPFKQASDADTADIRLKHAQAHAIYIDRGVLMPEEVTESVFGGDAYSSDVFVDVGSRSELDVDPTPEEMLPEPEPKGGEGEQ